jgi:hypothetical protein
MNRIYQGKVTKVEVQTLPSPEGKQGVGQSKPKPNWKPLSKQQWQQALWEHHELFQDESDETPLPCAANAVNCYTPA